MLSCLASRLPRRHMPPASYPSRRHCQARHPITGRRPRDIVDAPRYVLCLAEFRRREVEKARKEMARVDGDVEEFRTQRRANGDRCEYRAEARAAECCPARG